MAVLKYKDKDQEAGLEIGESSIICSCQAYKTLIKSIAAFVHNNDKAEDDSGQQHRYDLAQFWYCDNCGPPSA
jgi:hypothetical protein